MLGLCVTLANVAWKMAECLMDNHAPRFSTIVGRLLVMSPLHLIMLYAFRLPSAAARQSARAWLVDSQSTVLLAVGMLQAQNSIGILKAKGE